MEAKSSIRSRIVKVLLPIILGGAILYWMYRDFDFKSIEHVLFYEMSWTWMLLSFPFGILAQALRGWRWRQTLEPLDEKPRQEVALNSIFLSYAVSLLIPRVGEVTRCAVLKRWDGVSFPKALGTVVTERAIDSLLVIFITVLTLLFEMSIFGTFFKKTGMTLDTMLAGFSWAGWFVTAICALAVVVLAIVLFKNLSLYNKVKTTIQGIWEGVTSLRHVRNIPLYAVMTIGIWLSYFLHY